MISFWTWTISIIDLVLTALLILMALSQWWSPQIQVPPGIPNYVNKAPYRVRQPKRGYR